MSTGRSTLPFGLLLALLVAAAGCRSNAGASGSGAPSTAVEKQSSPLTALNRTAWTATACPTCGGTPQNAVDASGTSTTWITGQPQTSGQFLLVDMKATLSFASISMDTGAGVGNYPRGYQVFVSNDGTNFGTAVASGAGASSIVAVGTGPQTARYIKVLLTQSATMAWNVADFNVYNNVLPRTGWVLSSSPTGSGLANAIDGSGATRWSSGANQSSGQYFQIDMLGLKSINQITLDAGTSTNEFPHAFEVRVSRDGATSTFTNLAASATGSSQLVTVTFPSVTARYVRIVLTNPAVISNFWSISELNVFGSSETPTALPRAGWATAAGTKSTPAPANGSTFANAFDGSLTSRWTSGVNQAANEFFQVDLLAPQSFSQITIDAGNSTNDYPRGYQVFVSNDGTTFGSAIASGTGTTALVTVTFPLQNARYIKVVLTATAMNWWSISEFNVYGLAFQRTGWAATSSTVLSGTRYASNAIDGSAATSWTTGLAQAANQTFQLDMAVPETFTELTLDSGTSGQFPRSFDVFVSNDGASWGTAIATATGTADLVPVTFPIQTARFLKVVLKTTAAFNWTINELNVFRGCGASTCVASDQCHDAGTCDPVLIVCSNPAKTNGTTCNDSNACTTGETCQAGVCTNGTAVTCTADQCHTAGTCAAATGCPTPTNKTDGTTCDDANACTTGETCQAGLCTNGAAVTCTADQCHTAGTCAPATGCPTPTNKTSGTMCDDANACTTGETCQAGLCTNGAAVTCTADQCHTAGTCAPATGCPTPTNKTNGTTCDDANACTTGETCQAGLCTNGAAVTCTADQCHTVGTCAPATGCPTPTNKTNGTTCDDANACTSGETCQVGLCANGAAVTCTGADTCHTVGACVPASGCPAPVAKAPGTTCDDANACTTGETCQANGSCANGTAVTCAGTDQCTTVGACVPATGCPAPTPKADGTSCSDGSACTVNDTCQGGACTGSGITCQAPDQCHQSGTCDAAAVPTPPQTGLVGWWRLDGDTHDSSGNGLDLTNQGAQVTGGVSGRAFDFDGTACLSLAQGTTPLTLNGATGLTMMAWVRTATAYSCPTSRPRVIMGKGYDYSLASQCSSGNGAAPDLTGSAHPAGNPSLGFPGGVGALTRGSWTMVAVSWDGHNLRHYVNGQFILSYPLDGQIDHLFHTFAIGCPVLDFPSPPLDGYIGSIDEVSLYSRPLTDAEIGGYYAATRNPCSSPAKADGTTCDDGSACTQTDTCQAGACTGASPKPDGIACDDGVACTTGDRCQGGACVGNFPTSCPGPGPCQMTASCNPSTGCPTFVAAADGTSCSDGNVCTQTDTCHAGVCVGANPVTCVAPDACHGAGVCDPHDGKCSNPVVPAPTCQIGVFDYDNAGRLIRDHGTTLVYDAYDQLRGVSPGPAGPVQLTGLHPIDLGALEGGNFYVADDINLNGEIIGYDRQTPSHGLYYAGSGRVIDINQVAGVSGGVTPNRINTNGTVGGGFDAPDGTSHIFRFKAPSTFEDLGKIGDYAYGFGINESGQMAGPYYVGTTSHAYRYTDGVGFEDIEGLGGSNALAWTVADDGTIGGSSQLPGDTNNDPLDFAHFGHAFILRDTMVGPEDLNTVADPASAQGWVLVTARRFKGGDIYGGGLKDGKVRSYRMSLTTHALVDLGETGPDGNTYLNDANDYGDTTGIAYDGPGNVGQHGFVNVAGQGFVNLDSVVDPNDGWQMRAGSAINDAGDLVGFASKGGAIRGYLLRLPLRQKGATGPALAEGHTYGYDGLRTSTTTMALDGTNVHSQYWFTQDYTETVQGKREHYVRIGDRIVAKITMTPNGQGAFVPSVGLNSGKEESDRSGGGGWSQMALVGLLFALGLAGAAIGLAARRRRGWVPATAGVMALVLTATSCEMFGVADKVAAVWQLGTGSDAPHYFHQAIAPGPTIITDSAGVLWEERRYEPFGQPIDAKRAMGPVGAVNFAAEPQNILGKLTDPNTGWSYHGARWMAPQTARWMVPDPAVKAPSAAQVSSPWDLNPYAYGRQSPSLYWDRNGAEVNLAVFGRPGDRQYDIASAMLDRGEYPTVNAVMEQEKAQEAAGSIVPRNRTTDRYTMSDGIARGIERAEKEVMIQIAGGIVLEAAGLGARAIGRTLQASVEAVKDIRRARALEFFIDNGVKAESALNYVNGINLGKGVGVTTLKAGTKLIQYVHPDGVGRWFAKPGTSVNGLGIAPNGRVLQEFTLTKDVQVLKSTASDVVDNFTVHGQAIPAEGGATQFFIPDRSAVTPAGGP